MNFNNKSFLIILIICIVFVFIYNSSILPKFINFQFNPNISSKLNNSQNNSNLIPKFINSQNFKTNSENTNFQTEAYCHNEWESLNNNIDFRKPASFLFKDMKYINIYFLSTSNADLRINLKLKIYKDKQFLNEMGLKNVQNNRYNVYDNNGVYNLHYLKVDLDIHMLYNQIEDLLIEVFPYLSTNVITKNPINLKIKNLREKNHLKKEAMICSKIYKLDRDSYKILNWWFQLNKNIGFEKIVIYNNSIENSQNFDDVFLKHKDSVEVKQIQCFPDYIKNSNKYLRKLSDLKFNNEFSWSLRWLFEVLLFNECYLDNIDKYKYIAMTDQDELIIPRLLDKYHPLEKNLILIKQNNIQNNQFENFLENNQCKKASLDTNHIFYYKNELKNVFKFDDSRNIHFKMGYYLKDRIIKKILTKFKEYYKTSKNFTKPCLIHVIDLDPESEFHYPYNYTFDITNQMEHEYAIYLYNLYDKVMIPFYENSKLDKIPETYNRVFYIADKYVEKAQGKTVHSSKTSLHIAHHTSYNFGSQQIPYNYGHISHFRDSYIFGKDPIPIRDLYFDLNYFNCYFINNLKNKVS